MRWWGLPTVACASWGSCARFVIRRSGSFNLRRRPWSRGGFNLRDRPWSRRHAPCSYSPRCAAELRAGHAATPRGRVIWLRRAWPVLVGASPCPCNPLLLCGRKSAPTCQKSGGFHQGEVFRGRYPSLDTGGCDGDARKRPGQRCSCIRAASFLLVPSFRVDENYPISGRTPPENARFVMAELIKLWRSWRHAPCSNSPRCAAELRAGHAAATPRGPRLGARVRASVAA